MEMVVYCLTPATISSSQKQQMLQAQLPVLHVIIRIAIAVCSVHVCIFLNWQSTVLYQTIDNKQLRHVSILTL